RARSVAADRHLHRKRHGELVRRIREKAKLPSTFTLDACRHGGMTELEEAELTDGQGRALSAHKSRAYEGYAKRHMERALAATRKRHAHTIATANSGRTEFQNDPRNPFQNDPQEHSGNERTMKDAQ